MLHILIHGMLVAAKEHPTRQAPRGLKVLPELVQNTVACLENRLPFLAHAGPSHTETYCMTDQYFGSRLGHQGDNGA